MHRGEKTARFEPKLGAATCLVCLPSDDEPFRSKFARTPNTTDKLLVYCNCNLCSGRKLGLLVKAKSCRRAKLRAPPGVAASQRRDERSRGSRRGASGRKFKGSRACDAKWLGAQLARWRVDCFRLQARRRHGLRALVLARAAHLTSGDGGSTLVGSAAAREGGRRRACKSAEGSRLASATSSSSGSRRRSLALAARSRICLPMPV